MQKIELEGIVRKVETKDGLNDRLFLHLEGYYDPVDFPFNVRKNVVSLPLEAVETVLMNSKVRYSRETSVVEDVDPPMDSCEPEGEIVTKYRLEFVNGSLINKVYTEEIRE